MAVGGMDAAPSKQVKLAQPLQTVRRGRRLIYGRWQSIRSYKLRFKFIGRSDGEIWLILSSAQH